MTVSKDYSRWDLYKLTIEQCLREGYGPPRDIAASKGNAVDVAGLRLIATNQHTSKNSDFLRRWLGRQTERRDRGLKHWVPDWDLYPPRAARLGKLGYEPTLPGFEISETATSYNPDGSLRAQRVTQKPAAGPQFEMPPGQVLKSVSAFMAPDGRIIGQWVKTKEGADSPEALQAIKDAFQEYTGRAELSPPPEQTNADLLTAYVIGDHHLGLYAWKAETGGDYDLQIGSSLLHDTMTELVSASPPASIGLVLSLGDFFHMDDSFNRTGRSQNALDVDTRRAKVYKIGVKLIITCIELALQKHERVLVRCLPGNHDNETTPTLAISLWAFFHNEPRVDVDCSPSRFFHYQHGTTMLSATHGDMCKIQDMPGVMAANQPDMWGATRFRYALGGHIHHKEKFCKEFNGVICETFQVLPPADAWHAAMGFGAGRSMTSINYHAARGEISRNIFSIPPG